MINFLIVNINKIIIAIIVSVGAFLRFYNLGGQSLWSDEIFEISQTQKGVVAIFTEELPKIRFLINYLIIMIDNSVTLDKNEFLLRLPSAVLGTLSIYVIYLVGKELFNNKTGIMSAFLLAISPFHIEYSQEARSYAFTVLLSLITLLLLWKAISENKWLYWISFAVVSAINLDNHLTAGFVLIAQASFTIALLSYQRILLLKNMHNKDSTQRLFDNIKKELIKSFMNIRILFSLIEVKFTISFLLSIILYFPSFLGLMPYLLRVGLNFGVSNSSNIQNIHLSEYFINQLLSKFGGGEGIFVYFFGFGIITGLVWCFIKRQYAQAILMLIWLIIPLFFLPLVKTSAPFHLRHIIFILPILIISVSKAIIESGLLISRYVGYVSNINIPIYYHSSILLLVGIIGWSNVIAIQGYYDTPKEDWRGVSQYLLKNAQTNDLILQLSLWPRNGIPYYFNNDLSASNLYYLDVFDIYQLETITLPTYVWWIFRTENNEAPIEPEKINNLKEYLGPSYKIISFPRVAIIKNEKPYFKKSDIYQIAADLLLLQSKMDDPRYLRGYSWAWIELGNAEYKIGNYSGAANSYQYSIEAMPDLVLGYMYLANTKLKLNAWEDALQLYETAIFINPEYGPAYAQKWRVERELEISANGENFYKKALDLWGPEWIEICSKQLSDLFINQGEYAIASQIYREALEVITNSE
jgi:mannosyltransferase